MIGLNYGAYEDLGFRDGEHYIAYDGSREDLKKKINWYQRPENQDKLAYIAEMGCKYVRENFSQEKVAREYYENMLKILG